ncbi:2Fe-2S iron-sulfur cluster-binding protein [Brachyspira hyodysenteriae]|uniref:2Fe-2S iron-sulfur cluster-binding protein n=1 Tax=Brachyspira hyodysenteriae TaxID=159 RepID=UPI0022CD63CB|nr:2Fe-2S iron-sulfur cluster-binding protein [Brachyspira hyodysenteriae]MCZ9982190.1 2Fe-2S iron-sulfur cluster-binding protein [Brachyspira hyodysenteriae]MDA0067166.1 2Fe-2S iron-sulfur cluster-binding protein [Brachyspira hyodysenteriae]
MVKIKINGKQIEVEEGLTILKAAKKLGIKIPSLCYHPDIPPTSACGICVVKLANQGNKYVRSCSMLVEEGMDIITHDSEINTVRKGGIGISIISTP